MRTYIFLTYALHSYTGCPAYVRNKKIWLEQEGWKVLAFDFKQKLPGENDIDFDELKEFSDNRIPELKNPPAWLTREERQKILNKVLNKIEDRLSDIVIESNAGFLSEWGELLAKELKAKHLIYIIGEHPVIFSNEEFNFFDFKRKRNELFCISKEAYKCIFSKYLVLEDNELMYWNAMSTIPPQEVQCDYIDDIQETDYNIVHFGREKNYFPNMLTGLKLFIVSHKDKSFNLIFFGCETVMSEAIAELNNLKNLNIMYVPSVFPIPKKLFRISDVIIATAGCANIAYREGALVISMDVNTFKPLGFLGYTTMQSTYSNDEYPDSKDDLVKMLNDALIQNSLKGKKLVYDVQRNKHNYEYQMSFINRKKEGYFDVLSLKKRYTLKKRIKYLLFKLKKIYGR